MALPGLSCPWWGQRSNRACFPGLASKFPRMELFPGHQGEPAQGRKNTNCMSDDLAVPQVPICKMGTLPAAEAALGDQVTSQVPSPISHL